MTEIKAITKDGDKTKEHKPNRRKKLKKNFNIRKWDTWDTDMAALKEKTFQDTEAGAIKTAIKQAIQ